VSDRSQATAFRPAARADLPAIVALLADDAMSTGRELPGLPLDPRYLVAWERMAADPAQHPIAAERVGRLVGYLQLTIIPGLSFRGLSRGLIESVRVASDLRGQGIGAALIGYAVALCRDRGCGLVQLTSTNERVEAHRFYTRLGFGQTHAGFKLALKG
jgi:GNAT superfamily N-acetyltransferase